jgi:predicted CoA-binding protein
MATMTIKDAADAFLAHKRIAVAGVSRETGGSHGGNVIYNRLKERGFEAFAVNPNADELEGDKAYHSLAEIPDGVEAVVIATHPDEAASVIEDCAEAGIEMAWIHKAIGGGSLSEDAVRIAAERGVTVIPGGCPLMFEPCTDGGHKFMKTVLTWTGSVPRKV